MPKPKLTWAAFLNGAPYFTTLLYDALDEDTDISQLAPNYRAALYFDIFCAQVSNGGVTQYFFNKSNSLPNFERAPEYVAANPIFAPVQHLIESAHAAWDVCKEDVLKAQNEDAWPEELFDQYADRFDALQTEFYDKYHEVAQRFCQALVQNPHDYFDMEMIDGVQAKGVAYINLHNNTKHFRFKNGFPIGPNLFETRDGLCKCVTFSDARTTMECTTENLSHYIHYPSLRTITKRFNEGALETISTGFAFWKDDGIDENYRPSGEIKSTTLSTNNEEMGSNYYYPNGQISMTIEKQKHADLFTRYWPNGQKNVQYTQDKNFVERYFWCFDETGAELAPNGTGKVLMIYDENISEGRTWAEGVLNNGKLLGDLKRFEQHPKTKKKSKLP
jgi:hypothetical protein